MNITLQTPKVYQYPETGRPDEGLEVYLWPDGNIDCFLNGRETPFERRHPFFILFLGANRLADWFDLETFEFNTLTVKEAV